MSYPQFSAGASAPAVTAQVMINPLSAGVQSSPPILFGGYYFRITGTDSDLKLEVAKSDAGLSSGLLFMYQKIDSANAITADTTADQTISAVYPAFAAVTVPGSNIVAAYEQVEFNAMSRNSTLRLWKLTMIRNGNGAAFLTCNYFGN